MVSEQPSPTRNAPSTRCARLLPGAMMAMLIMGHMTVAGAGEIWSLYQSYHILSCYSPDELCDRYGRNFDPNGIGNLPGCISREPDPRTGWYNGIRISSGDDLCADGEVNIAADAGGCWPKNIQCSVPPAINPNLGGSQCADSNPLPLVGNPIHVATGNKYQLEVDRDGGQSTLAFKRHYNSLASETQKTSIGNKWRHTFSTRLSPLHADADARRMVVRKPDGSEHYYYLTASGYRSKTSSSQLTFANRTWRLLSPTGREETFDEGGRLASVRHAGGPTVSLLYDENGLLTEIGDHLGRHLTLQYDSEARVTSVTDTSGANWRYAYDHLGNLAAITFPDTTPDDSDNPTRLYHYEDARFPSHLTGITDERGNRTATWTYDGQGRAISGTHGDGADNHRLIFNADNTTSVTDPLGRQRTYHYTTLNGLIKVDSVTAGGCSSCPDHAVRYTYDTEGFLASETDPNGNLTVYTRDDLGRELSRTEAFGTPEARTIRTTWLPDLHRPVTVTEPGRVTTYTYDTEGRVISSSVQSSP